MTSMYWLVVALGGAAGPWVGPASQRRSRPERFSLAHLRCQLHRFGGDWFDLGRAYQSGGRTTVECLFDHWRTGGLYYFQHSCWIRCCFLSKARGKRHQRISH